QEDEHRADIDGEEFEAPFGGEADRTEEGPRCAVDGEAERVDVGPRPRRVAPRRPAVAQAWHDEEQRHIGDRYEDDEKALHARKIPPSAALCRLSGKRNHSLGRESMGRGCARFSTLWVWKGFYANPLISHESEKYSGMRIHADP